MEQSVGVYEKRMNERYRQAAQMGWLRNILRVTRRDGMRNEVIREVLHQELETLVNKINKKSDCMTWFGHVTRMNETRPPPRAMHCHIEWTWNVGRQPKRWIDNIKNDIADLGLTIRTATYRYSANDWRKSRDVYGAISTSSTK